MLSPETIISFFGVALLMAAAPGPEIIFILGQSLAYGRRVGLIVSLGNVGALLIPTAATALGLGALIVASPVAYGLLKYVGAFYLAFLGIKELLSASDADAPSLVTEQAPTGSLALRGAILCLTNPQTMPVFLAFIPQFIDVKRGGVGWQVVSLGLLNMLASYVVFAAVALASGVVRHRVEKSPVILRIIDRVTAIVLIGLAVRLVFT